MKKSLYFPLFIVELFVGVMLMISLLEGLFYIPIAVSAVVAGLLIWQLVWYFKTDNTSARSNILRNIALILLIPIAAFIVTYIVVAIAFIVAFVN